MNLTERVTDLENRLYTFEGDKPISLQKELRELQTAVSHLREDIVHLIEMVGVKANEFYCDDELLPWEHNTNLEDEDESNVKDDEEELQVLCVRSKAKDKSPLFLRISPIKADGYRKWWTCDFDQAHLFRNLNVGYFRRDSFYKKAFTCIPKGYGKPAVKPEAFFEEDDK